MNERFLDKCRKLNITQNNHSHFEWDTRIEFKIFLFLHLKNYGMLI